MKDKLVTLIGGGGFLGRYVAQELLAAGARVRVAERDPRRAYFLKPLGGLGQTQFATCDVTKPDTVARAVAGSDAVVYLVGTWGPNFAGIQQGGLRAAAAASAAAGIEAFVDLSTIGADPESDSQILRDEGRGRSRGARGVSRCDDPASVGGIRARGQVHQPVRSDDRGDAGGAGAQARRRPSSRSMSSMSPRRWREYWPTRVRIAARLMSWQGPR